MKKVLVLFLFAITLNSCGEGCGDCCLGDPCHEDGWPDLEKIDIGEKPISALNYVFISNICDKESPDYSQKQIAISCKELKDLDYKNNTPSECQEITFNDIDGNTQTGIYFFHLEGTECD